MTDTTPPRDHGGGLDAAISRYGGTRADWVDLSTGINPVPYPVGDIPADAWTALPDAGAMDALVAAARRFWRVPEGAGVLAAPGASALIARLPYLAPPGTVAIPGPTYNEHEAAFRAAGWQIGATGKAEVIVHPNNPDGKIWTEAKLSGHDLTVIDESFCDVMPERSLIPRAAEPNTVILKSFGKFWGLAGLRLGFAIARPATLQKLSDMLGPWPVSGPALTVGTRALSDRTWADTTRNRLNKDAARLDKLMTQAGATFTGGTPLFRLYETDDAAIWQTHLAQHQIWSRIFPYSKTWLRLGLPNPTQWPRLETALGTAGGAMAQPSVTHRP